MLNASFLDYRMPTCLDVPMLDTVIVEVAFPSLKSGFYDEAEDMVMSSLAVVVDGETAQLGILAQVRQDSEMHFLSVPGGGL
jgi:xanthine dehydrogenase molybdenum-binding subunit